MRIPKLPIPAPAVFLVGAALLREAAPGLAPSIRTVEWIATVALVVILFDGGASIGLRRFRASVVPIALLGTVGDLRDRRAGHRSSRTGRSGSTG